MVVRVTASEVKAIMVESVDETRIDPFINSANFFINRYLENAYTEEVLKEMELWYTAHLLSSTTERLPYRVEGLGTGVSYKVPNPSGINGTAYGQQVLLLDTQGIIKDLDKERASFKAIIY